MAVARGLISADVELPADGGVVGAMMRRHDWSTSPLGAPQTWPQSLRSVVGLLLSSKFPMFVAWGDELGLLYNDAYAELLGAKHPGALGARFHDVWAEIWPDISPLIDAAMAGDATYREDLPLLMNRKGFDEQTWFTFSYSPVRDESGAVAGMFCTCTETTSKVLLERRQAFRLSLEERLRGAAEPREIMDAAVEALGRHLGAARVGYSEVRPDGETIDCRSCYAHGVDPLFGTFKLADFGAESIKRQRRGETEVTADIRADPAQVQDTWAALETRAFVSVPLVRDGALRASLYVNRREPYAWSADEVALIEEVAVSTWSAVERAVAEAREREKATRLKLALEAGRLAEVTFALNGSVRHSAAYAELFGHPPDKALTLGEIRAQYHPDDHDRVVGERARILKSGQGFYQVEKRIVRPNGEVRWVYGRGQVERDAEGRALTVTAVYIDDTERKQAEVALRASEARQTFLLALGDRLRSLSDAEDVKAAAAEMLGRHFGVARAGYGEIDDAEEVVRVDRDWSDGVTSLAGEARLLDGFGASVAAELRAGRTLRVDDCLLDPRVQGEGVAEAWAGIELRAIVAVPLVKEGRLSAFLYLHEPEPRAWTDDEEALAREVAERTWEAVERARSEAALRESEARLAAVVESLPVGVGVVDLKGGILLSNPELRRFLPTGRITSHDEGRLPRWRGWRPDGRPVNPLDFPGARAVRGERVVPGLEMLYTDDEGKEVWTTVATVPIEDGEGRLIGHTIAIGDIDALKRSAEALRASEERLREINATLEERVAERTAERDRIWRLPRDLMCVARTDGTLLAVNPAWERLLGWSAGWLTGRNAAEIKHPEDEERTKAELARLAAGRSTFGFEDRYRHKDGGWRWISWTIEPEGDLIYCIGRDVTAEKERQAELAAAEAARREADALYRAYFENTAEALFVVNVLEGGGFTIEDLNPAHQASVGLPLAEVAGKRIDEILPPEIAKPMQDHYRRALFAGEVYQYRETFDVHGRTTHWDTVLVPVRDGDGRIIRLIGSSRDLTKQLAAEEQLRQSQKMEAMGQLTGGVAHDFNNLLTPIVGSLDMLQRRGLGGEREQRLIAGAMQSAERAKTLVQRLLAFARRQPLQPTTVDVATLVTGLADLIESTSGPQIKVVVEATDALPPAKADPNQLEMALLNLSVNARDAMPEGGTLRISVSEAQVEAGHLSKLQAGRYVRLSVADTGVGMDEATLARSIEPFFSTKGVGKGTGLGLSMAHGLASQLGGALTIRSRRGVGTNVELWLPISQEAVKTAASNDPADLGVTGAGVVLLVDDEELVRMSTADMLGDLGYRVVEAASAEEALKLVRAGLRLDALVSDHLMPGMTGTDLANIVRSEQPDVRVLIVSGYAEAEGVALDLPRLTKPFRNDELAASLAGLWTQAPD